MPINSSTVSIHAPIQKVWEALTRPELVKKWQYGSDLSTDWKVGSDIRFSAQWEGKRYEQWGKVLLIIPFQIIRYSLFAPDQGLEDQPENYFVMDYVLTEQDDVTVLEFRKEDNRPNAVQEEPQGEESPVLQALKLVAESN